MKFYISKEEDRLKVAAVLVKNGYIVSQGKERKTPNGKSYVYFINAEVQEDATK